MERLPRVLTGDYLLEFTEKEPTLEFSFLRYEPRDFKLTPGPEGVEC